MTVEPPASAVVEPTQTLEVLCRWTPHSCLEGELPPGFTMEFECWRRLGETRYFVGVGGRGKTLEHGFAAGLAILIRHFHWDAEQRSSERVRFLFFRVLRRVKEFQRRQFRGVRDLQIRKNSRTVDEITSVLPPEVDRGQDWEGRSWKLDELLAQGNQTAKTRGIPSPTMRQKIHYGLLAAARRNPLHLPPEQVEPLVRRALFRQDETVNAPLGEQNAEHLQERILAALWPHLDDDQETFDKWIAGTSSSFIKQIAKQTKAPGGAFPQGVVRQFLLDLGWSGYLSVAQCLECLMSDFRRALPEPLSETERVLFERTYFRQPAFGNLSLVMLTERLPDIQAAAMDHLNGQQDEETIPVLHRLLSYYVEMAEARRIADQLGKQKERHRRKYGSALDVPFEDWRETSAETQEEEDDDR